MKLKVLFTLNNARKSGVKTNYHPTWTSDSKPEHNSGMLVFSDVEWIEKEQAHHCEIIPLCPELWYDVRLNDVLRCMEGSRQVGEAIVLEIMSP